MKEEFELIAKTFQGLEEVLAKELTELGASNIEIGRRMVAFMGDKEMMYKANFCLRTAIRILKPIKHFEAKNADEVYEAIKTIARRRRRSYDSARKEKIKTGSMALSHTSFAFNQDDISVCRRSSCRIQWLPSGRGRCTPYSECNSCPRPVYCFSIQCC